MERAKYLVRYLFCIHLSSIHIFSDAPWLDFLCMMRFPSYDAYDHDQGSDNDNASTTKGWPDTSDSLMKGA
jgi:hypothetical protein